MSIVPLSGSICPMAESRNLSKRIRSLTVSSCMQNICIPGRSCSASSSQIAVKLTFSGFAWRSGLISLATTTNDATNTTIPMMTSIALRLIGYLVECKNQTASPTPHIMPKSIANLSMRGIVFLLVNEQTLVYVTCFNLQRFMSNVNNCQLQRKLRNCGIFNFVFGINKEF